MTYYQTLTRLFSELKHSRDAKIHPNPGKRSGSDDSDHIKRARFSRQSMVNGYVAEGLELLISTQRRLTAPNSENSQPHNQPRPHPFHSTESNRNPSNVPDIAATMHQNQSHHSTDGSQRSSSRGSTPQQQYAQPFSASHFIFTPPGVEPQNFSVDSIFGDAEYAGFSDAQVGDPLLDDPSVNDMDLFGSVAWGTLNGKS